MKLGRWIFGLGVLVGTQVSYTKANDIIADGTSEAVVIDKNGCYRGLAKDLVEKCDTLPPNEKCCQAGSEYNRDNERFVVACDWPGFMNVTICPGSCNGNNACRFGFDSPHLFHYGQEIYIGNNSCNGNGACKDLGQFPTEDDIVPGAMNPPIEIKSDSCVGHLNTCRKFHGHSIGSGSCKSLPLHNPSACGGVAGDIGANSCIGHGSCKCREGNVGEHSCHGRYSCSDAEGDVGNRACTSASACEESTSVGDCIGSCDPQQACSESVVMYYKETEQCHVPHTETLTPCNQTLHSFSEYLSATFSGSDAMMLKRTYLLDALVAAGADLHGLGGCSPTTVNATIEDKLPQRLRRNLQQSVTITFSVVVFEVNLGDIHQVDFLIALQTALNEIFATDGFFITARFLPTTATEKTPIPTNTPSTIQPSDLPSTTSPGRLTPAPSNSSMPSTSSNNVSMSSQSPSSTPSILSATPSTASGLATAPSIPSATPGPSSTSASPTTSSPSASLSGFPSASPTASFASSSPTEEAVSVTPSRVQSVSPTESAMSSPPVATPITSLPSTSATRVPTVATSPAPSSSPSGVPPGVPASSPTSAQASSSPTSQVSSTSPTGNVSESPTQSLTTAVPSTCPTTRPSESPSGLRSEPQLSLESSFPSSPPTATPTSSAPTSQVPSKSPTGNPSVPPTQAPASAMPSTTPSAHPSESPSGLRTSPQLSLSPIREYSDRFTMPVERDNCTTYHRMHSTRSWTTRTMGRCQQRCRTPARMESAAFGNTVIVSWVGSTPTPELGESESDQSTRRFGHLSTFNFTESNGFAKVDDFWYEDCNHDMGQVAVNSDGSVIGALCVARENHVIEGAKREPQFGTNTAAGRRRKMYLFEWTGGQITQTPDRIVLLQTNIGGAHYGHWALSLSSDSSRYFVKLKVSVHHGAHESAVSYYILRNENYRLDNSISSKTGCGNGHTISNRVVYNSFNGVWSQMCGVDSERAVRWTTTNFKRTTLLSFERAGPVDYPAGGAANMISLGENGMLASALGPEDVYEELPPGSRNDARQFSLEDQKIGIKKLPLTVKELEANQTSYPWRWITPCGPTRQKNAVRAGIVQLHNWGQGGESSGRYILGYSPSMRFQGYSDEFHAVEINEQGEFLHDPVVLETGGWGEDSLGAYMPGSGCVVYPHAWFGGRTAPFSKEPDYNDQNDPITDRSIYMRLTALCPDDRVPRETPFSQCKGVQPTQDTKEAPRRGDPKTSESCPASSQVFVDTPPYQ